MGLFVRLPICGNTTPLLAMLHDVPADILDLDFMVLMERLAPRSAKGGSVATHRIMRADMASKPCSTWGPTRSRSSPGC